MPKNMSGTEAKLLRTLRARAHRHQGGLCYWCKLPMIETDEPVFRQLTGDHLIPMHAGGKTIPGNIVAACRKCNNGRHPELNSIGVGLVAQTGDDAGRSPFEVLAALKSATP